MDRNEKIEKLFESSLLGDAEIAAFARDIRKEAIKDKATNLKDYVDDYVERGIIRAEDAEAVLQAATDTMAWNDKIENEISAVWKQFKMGRISKEQYNATANELKKRYIQDSPSMEEGQGSPVNFTTGGDPIYTYDITGTLQCERVKIQQFLNGVGKLINKLGIKEIREIGATLK